MTKREFAELVFFLGNALKTNKLGLGDMIIDTTGIERIGSRRAFERLFASLTAEEYARVAARFFDLTEGKIRMPMYQAPNPCFLNDKDTCDRLYIATTTFLDALSEINVT